jgi:two-component system, OmpR family, sensor histidine kinase CiaH
VTASRAFDLRRLSINVALRATLLVALLYLAVAIGVVAIFSQNEISLVDGRLAMALSHPNPHFDSDEGPYGPPTAGGPGGVPVVSWLVLSDGSVHPDSRNDFTLPAAYTSVTRAQTVTIDDVEMRVAGEPVQVSVGGSSAQAYLVVGQSLKPLNQSRATIVFAEILIAPVVLLAVFVGAVVIGRRVATPIEQARQRQMEFTADASHELRTPLSVIEAQTSLALAQERQTDWYRTAFGRVGDESKRMRRLIEDMLWLARFDATTAAPAAEPVDLGILAEQAADRFGVIAEARHLRLTVTGSDAGAVVALSPEWLDRLLGVLLDNACKYSRDRGTVEVRVAVEGSRVRLSVDDDGPGIPENERDRIFDRFRRLQADGTAGAGLGLAIADAIVRATGGRWQVGESSMGGARMSVTWPSAFGGRRSGAGIPTHQPGPGRGRSIRDMTADSRALSIRKDSPGSMPA